MNFRQAKLTILIKLLGYRIHTTYEGYHYIHNPNPRRIFKPIYIEDL